MAPDPLGIRCYTNFTDVQFLYLDLGKKYYSFHEEVLEPLVKDDISDDELLISPECMVTWR